ncbi:hypothetical protein NFI96_018571 [Prochilodus magdalenae]|nr:hypothetical protein NFI96_018571 [Prochilodus magdalenae]
MSLSPHQRGNISNIAKQSAEAVEGAPQHSGEVFYNAEQTHSGAGGRADPSHDLQGSGVFKTEKAYQVWGHFQQSGPVKWVHQDPVQPPAWFQGTPNTSKLSSQGFGPSLSGMDEGRAHQALHKTNHDMDALQQDKMAVGSSVPFSEPSQVLAPGMEWNHHTMAAMHHAQFLQQGHKPGDPQYQPHGLRHTMPDSTLQPFQLAFGVTKQPQGPGFYQAFPGNSASQNLGYSEQPKSQQLMQLQQQQLQHQQQMHQMHQMQQQQQQQQQRLHQMQQQYHHQQKLQQMQQQQQQQQLQQQMQSVQQPDSYASQSHPQDQRPARPQQLDDSQLKVGSSALSQKQPPSIQAQTQDSSPQSPVGKDPGPATAPQDPQEPHNKPEVVPRRSRRLSKDGLSPVSSQPPKEPARNGGMGAQGPSVGVIQSTQRRRRASKEINLETLAQKASEMEFLPAKRDEGPSGRQAGMVPLVIPVSVPVRRNQGQTEQTGAWGQEQRPPSESVQQQYQYDRKPSVIVARRRSLRNSLSDSLNQDEATEDGKSQIKRRPRPEPLVIPPPKPCTFIAPSYPSITTYQSHLRSPIRSLDHPLSLPPYTPPPILSPVREGTGLYFSTFLSSIAAGTQGLPPPPTPKTSRSLLRSSSADITPPVLPLIGEATPVSLEPRINIGSQYQAEIPELQDRPLALQDQHKATVVWLPMPEAESTPLKKERVDNLMSMACSSVLCGGGTNVELMHHCLYENKGDIMKTLEVLLTKHPVFSRNHHLANYHYAGSDCWTADEKRYFNKGITAYRKDFFLVQKLVRSKTVAQCVEFYYTYKKQVRAGRNGTLTYGPPDPEQSTSEMTPKQEQQPLEEAEEKKQKVQTKESENAGGDNLKTLSQTLHFKEDVDKVLVLSIPKISSLDQFTALRRENRTPASVPKPRPESTGKRSQPSAASKSQGEPEGVFPCKKCSRVFYKVKSRSAHMKSHAEQEKKAAAAAQRQREEEEAAAKARLEAAGAARMLRGGEEDEQEDSSEPEDEEDDDWA